MAVTVLFGNELKRNKIDTIEIDVTLEEIHDRSAEITDHPVEGGSYMHDHIVNAPKRLKLSGMITDTPLGEDSDVRSRRAFADLEELYDRRTIFSVSSGFAVYDNMAIESLSLPKTREGALRFSIELKQLVITQGQTVPIELNRTDKNLSKSNVSNPDKNANGINAGRQQTSTTSEDKKTKSSALRSLLRNF